MQQNQKAMAYLMAIDKNASKMIGEHSTQKNTKAMTCQLSMDNQQAAVIKIRESYGLQC